MSILTRSSRSDGTVFYIINAPVTSISHANGLGLLFGPLFQIKPGVIIHDRVQSLFSAEQLAITSSKRQ